MKILYNFLCTLLVLPFLMPVVAQTYDQVDDIVSSATFDGNLMINMNDLAPPFIISGDGLILCSNAKLYDYLFHAGVPDGQTINWYADAAGTVLLASDSDTYTPYDENSNLVGGTYYAQAVDPINNFVSSELTPFTLNIQPLATFEVTSIVCSADETTYIVNFIGDATVSSSAGTVVGNQIIDIPITDFVQISIEDPNCSSIPLAYAFTPPDCNCAIEAPFIISGDGLILCPDAQLFDYLFHAGVPDGQTINWYADAAGTELLSSDSDTYTPFGENGHLVGGTYYAQAVNSFNNCVSDELTPFTLNIQPLDECGEPPIAVCDCAPSYVPVCGVDGVTYSNECVATCEGVEILYDGPCEQNPANVCEVNIKMFLQGALIGSADGLMRDDLRVQNLLPLSEPFTTLPYFTHLGGGGETVSSSVFNVAGVNAITDWVFLELRDELNNLVATHSALLQRDGDVVDVDGVSPVTFNVPNGNYHVCVRHRNHLGTMTADALIISSDAASMVDFSSVATYGEQAQFAWDNINALWAGHTDNTGFINFQGSNNNVNNLFFGVLTAPNNENYIPNYIYEGYHEGDINMDGRLIYQGASSDVNHIFFTTLQHPGNTNFISNFTIYEQMP